MRVLVADDDAATRQLVAKTLSKCGYEVLSCSDGSQAWERLKSEPPPELAILDWMMPGVDGPELCRRVRQSPNAVSTYVILLTGQGRREDIIEGLNAGAHDYLVKPFDPRELCARMRVGERLMEMQTQQLVRETEHYVEQLDLAQAEVQRSRQRIVGVQEEARKQLAEEFHGPVQTKPTELHMRLGEIGELIGDSSQEVHKELAQTAADLDSVRENEIRMVSHALHTSILNVGLQAGMKTLRDQFERRLSVSLDISRTIVERDPP